MAENGPVLFKECKVIHNSMNNYWREDKSGSGQLHFVREGSNNLLILSALKIFQLSNHIVSKGIRYYIKY